MADTYTARCTTCRFLPRGAWQDVAPAARAHEQTVGHRVQVTPAGPSVAPLPRSLWATCDSTLTQLGETFHCSKRAGHGTDHAGTGARGGAAWHESHADTSARCPFHDDGLPLSLPPEVHCTCQPDAGAPGAEQ